MRRLQHRFWLTVLDVLLWTGATGGTAWWYAIAKAGQTSNWYQPEPTAAGGEG